jgi:tRNA uridine 5-carboxymethylaminomethyl modification enzyme
MPVGRRVGLVGDDEYSEFRRREEIVAAEVERFRAVRVSGEPLALLLKRPGTTYDELRRQHAGLVHEHDPEIERRIELEIKYEGYLDKQRREVERMAKTEWKRIPPGVEFRAVRGLRAEAAEKLTSVRPETFGQASRVAGINPSDLAVLSVYLAGKKEPQISQMGTE